MQVFAFFEISVQGAFKIVLKKRQWELSRLYMTLLVIFKNRQCRRYVKHINTDFSVELSSNIDGKE